MCSAGRLPITYEYDANDRLLAEAKDDLTVADQDRFTEYAYDGTQQTGKIVHQGLSAGGTTLEETSYDYNLQGRMSVVTIDADGNNTPETQLEYDYNDEGIRVAQEKRVDDEGDGFDDETPERTDYLIDAQNPTGYAQVLEEWINGTLSTTYTIGHDVFAEAAVNGALRRLLKDGHGSTRMLVDALGMPITANGMVQVFRFDAYGNPIGFDPALALTSLLYNSEHFDWRTGLSYLRARYYDPNTGTFNRLDPFRGNLNDPQSLHKYLFVHSNPINGIDPSGLTFSTVGMVATIGISIAFAGVTTGVFIAAGRNAAYGMLTGVLGGATLTAAYATGNLPRVVLEGTLSAAITVGTIGFLDWLRGNDRSWWDYSSLALEAFAWSGAGALWLNPSLHAGRLRDSG